MITNATTETPTGSTSYIAEAQALSISMEPLAISAAEAATMLGVSRPTVYTLMRREDFPSFKIGSRNLISVDGLKKMDCGPNRMHRRCYLWLRNQAHAAPTAQGQSERRRFPATGRSIPSGRHGTQKGMTPAPANKYNEASRAKHKKKLSRS